MHPLIALRAFFAVLFNKKNALRVQEYLDAKLPTRIEPPKTEAPVQATLKPVTKPKGADRNGALTLLSMLQRESRLLDLIFESLEQYSDTQIGAAARDVLRDSRKSLERSFGLKPLVDLAEGDRIELPEQASPIRWRLIGSSSVKAGTLSHRGWQATRVEVPQWSGNSDDALVIAAAEIEA
jgi:hypothetical protein